MPVYLDTTGNSVLSVAICDRCNRKFPYVDLMPDPNFPGMRVCKDDLDNYDPWRLPARQTENIALRFPRPDQSVATGPIGGTQLVTGVAPTGEIYAPVGGTTQPNDPNRNSIFITQTREVATTAGKPGDLTTAGGLSQYPNTPVPEILSCTPTTGVQAGGTFITVTGNSFIGITTVKLGGTTVAFTLVNPSTITFTSPAYAVTGLVDLTVISTFGTATLHGAFTYTT
jgi:hypothetical protein